MQLPPPPKLGLYRIKQTFSTPFPLRLFCISGDVLLLTRCQYIYYTEPAVLEVEFLTQHGSIGGRGFGAEVFDWYLERL